MDQGEYDSVYINDAKYDTNIDGVMKSHLGLGEGSYNHSRQERRRERPTSRASMQPRGWPVPVPGRQGHRPLAVVRDGAVGYGAKAGEASLAASTSAR